jgi:hypothetical protein|nr:MAG TPA: hypothetical protein [Caudoviricetes sp.]
MTNYARKIKLNNRTVYIINDNDIVLQSYNAFVARIHDRKLTLGPLYDYSPTTWRHVRKFIDCYKSKLDSRTYIYIVALFKSKNGHETMKAYIANNIVQVVDNVGLRQGEA